MLCMLRTHTTTSTYIQRHRNGLGHHGMEFAAIVVQPQWISHFAKCQSRQFAINDNRTVAGSRMRIPIWCQVPFRFRSFFFSLLFRFVFSHHLMQCHTSNSIVIRNWIYVFVLKFLWSAFFSIQSVSYTFSTNFEWRRKAQSILDVFFVFFENEK